MSTAPSLNPPRLGDPIAPGCEYVKRTSAVAQAGFWNEALAADPIFGPASGFRVGIGMRMGGAYPLVWLPVPNEELDAQRRPAETLFLMPGMPKDGKQPYDPGYE